VVLLRSVGWLKLKERMLIWLICKYKELQYT